MIDSVAASSCFRGVFLLDRDEASSEELKVSVGDYIRNSQIWKSVFRHPAPTDRRNRVVVMLTRFFSCICIRCAHKTTGNHGPVLTHVVYGRHYIFLFLVETITGVLLMFYYRPTLEWAFYDIQALRDVQTLGIMREIHRWAGLTRW